MNAIAITLFFALAQLQPLPDVVYVEEGKKTYVFEPKGQGRLGNPIYGELVEKETLPNGETWYVIEPDEPYKGERLANIRKPESQVRMVEERERNRLSRLRDEFAKRNMVAVEDTPRGLAFVKAEEKDLAERARAWAQDAAQKQEAALAADPAEVFDDAAPVAEAPAASEQSPPVRPRQWALAGAVVLFSGALVAVILKTLVFG